jgi:hypothetical protein
VWIVAGRGFFACVALWAVAAARGQPLRLAHGGWGAWRCRLYFSRCIGSHSSRPCAWQASPSAR